MTELKEWETAKSPNYQIHKDKHYPYSELPYQGRYKLVKIPVCMKHLIEHVDYFGRGIIESNLGLTGFKDCYNVHYEYTLVCRSSPFLCINRKIPNRIPIPQDGSEWCTRNYIKENSVLTVTFVNDCSYILTEPAAQDIVRIVNGDAGKVIVYGEDDEFLSQELKKMKQFFECPNYLLPEKLQLSKYKTKYTVYLSLNELKNKLYDYVSGGDYKAAVILTQALTDDYCCNAVSEVVNKLLENNVHNVMIYAYKLWDNDFEDIVCKYFPTVFKLIFNGDDVMIINKLYNQALKLEGPNEMRAWGDHLDKSSNKVSWTIIPIWDDDKIRFKLYNNYEDMYLHLSPTVENNGDRQARGSKLNDGEDSRYIFCLEPLMLNGQVVFTIFNCEFSKRLKLAPDMDTSGDREVFGHKGVNNDQDDHFRWILAAWNKLEAHFDHVNKITIFTASPDWPFMYECQVLELTHQRVDGSTTTLE